MFLERRPNLQAQLEQAGVAYPRVTNLPARVRERINMMLRKAAGEAVVDYDPGTNIVEANSSYLVTVNTNGILSVKFENYFYPENAAHGVTGVSSITLNLQTACYYEFEDLFLKNSNYQAVINEIINNQIICREIPLLKPFEGVAPDTNYYLTPDSLIIYYQPYEYTPGAYGVLEFDIPFTLIQSIIDPEGPIGRLEARD